VTSPTVAVVLPVYNAETTIRASIESVLVQTYRDFVLLVVDDGSTDKSSEIIKDLASRDNRIRYLSKANGGIVSALNFGLDACTCEYIARQDADDLSTPDRFATQLEILRDRPDVVAVSGAHHHIDEAGRVIDQGFFYTDPNTADFLVIPHLEPYLPHPFLMIRRSALRAVGGYYRYVIHSEDTDLYWRLREVGTLFNTSRLLGSYRLHSKSLSDQSIQAGRVQAVYSQMAGLSAMRRFNGLSDIEFPPNVLESLKDLVSLEEIAALASKQLDKTEQAYLHACVAAKLLELLSFRSYAIEGPDIRFVAANLRQSNCNREVWNKSEETLKRLLLGLGKRLVKAGRMGASLRVRLIFGRLFVGQIVHGRWIKRRVLAFLPWVVSVFRQEWRRRQ